MPSPSAAESPRYCTPKQFSKERGLSINTTIHYINTGELEAINYGKRSRPRWRITAEAIAKFESSRRNHAAPLKRPVRRPRPVSDVPSRY